MLSTALKYSFNKASYYIVRLKSIETVEIKALCLVFAKFSVLLDLVESLLSANGDLIVLTFN